MTTTGEGRGATVIVSKQINLTAIECWVCGLVYAVPFSWDRRNETLGRSWHCPAGCLVRYGESYVERLRRELERTQARLTHANDQRDAAERSKAAIKGQVTKLKKRVGKGVCPGCNRHFANLEAHMQSRHPDFHNDNEIG